MSDFDHFFSADLSDVTSGDIPLSSGIVASQQRIIRRVLTNPGDYIWHPEYGCGAPKYVGETTNKINELKTRIFNQLPLEPSISMSPTPSIVITTDNTTLTCVIKYVDVETGTPQILTFDTGAI